MTDIETLRSDKIETKDIETVKEERRPENKGHKTQRRREGGRKEEHRPGELHILQCDAH